MGCFGKSISIAYVASIRFGGMVFCEKWDYTKTVW